MTSGRYPLHLAPFFLGLALCAVMIWSVTVGSTALSMTDVIKVLSDPDADTREAIIVWNVRLPRVLAAIVVGAALGGAGAIMQAATSNPLADPGLLGVNAGAAFAVVVLIVVFGVGIANSTLIWAAFAGAFLAAMLVYGLGALGRSGLTPVKLVLSGVVVSTFLGVLTAALLIVDKQTLDAVRLWTAGTLRGKTLQDIFGVAPYIVFGLIVACLLRNQFTTLSLGSDVAQGLGQNPRNWRLVSALIVVVLAGGAATLAGPIGFVGLVVPHLARFLVGSDYGRILPLAMVGGALLTLLADVLPRAIWGNDIPVGVSTALLGAPFFIWLAHGRLGPGQ